DQHPTKNVFRTYNGHRPELIMYRRREQGQRSDERNGLRALHPQTVNALSGEGVNLSDDLRNKGIPSIDRSRAPLRPVPWAMKGGLAIFDQGLVAGSRFLVSILLARWLSSRQYGAYALAYAVFLLLLMLYQSLLLEPMTVFG